MKKETVKTTKTDLYRVMVTGHRPQEIGGYQVPNPTEQWIRLNLRNLLGGLLARHGASLRAVTGMAIGVDMIYAEEALSLGIPIWAALPIATQESRWPDSSKERYRDVLRQAERVVQVWEEEGYAAPSLLVAYLLRNQWMLDNSEGALAVWNGKEKGGTYDAVKRLRKAGRKFVHLDPVKGTVKVLAA